MPDQWRQLALEVVVTLSETAPAMVRKYDKFLGLLGESCNPSQCSQLALLMSQELDPKTAL